MRNTPTTHHFAAGDEAAIARFITEAMTEGGWVNFAPGLLEDLEEFLPREGPFSALFGRPVRPFAEVSVVPGKSLAIGITHGAGRLGASGLAERGLKLAEGWKLTQDHTRRGVVLEAGVEPKSVAHFVATALVTLTATPAQLEWSALRYGVKN